MTYPFPFSNNPLPLPHNFYVSNSPSFHYTPQLSILPLFNPPFQYQQNNPNTYFYNQFCQQTPSLKIQQQYPHLSLLSNLKQAAFSTNPQPYSFKFDQKIEPNYVKSEASSVTEPEVAVEILIKEEFQNSMDKETLKEQIRTMLELFIKEFGQAEANELIKSKRPQYAKNSKLLKLFDALYEKYGSAAKCREDIIRFVLRKAITYMRDIQREKRNVSAKSATILLCKRYFSSRLEEMTQNNININDEKELVKFLMPYKKNSRNKTPNNCFMKEIFSSKAFYEDYLNYLHNLDSLLGSDNKKKIERILDFLVTCVEEDKLAKIRDYKRMPWIDCWLETTKKIAQELLEANTTAEDGEKPKVYRGKKRKNF